MVFVVISFVFSEILNIWGTFSLGYQLRKCAVFYDIQNISIINISPAATFHVADGRVQKMTVLSGLVHINSACQKFGEFHSHTVRAAMGLGFLRDRIFTKELHFYVY